MFNLFNRTAFSALAAGACLTVAGSAAADTVRMEQIASSPIRGSAVAVIDQAPLTAADSRFEPDALPVSLLVRKDAPGAEAWVDQTGAAAYSVIVQENSLGGLYAEVHQSAPGAQSFILQSGGANTALVYQTGSAGAYSSIVQSGFGNMATVRQ